MSVPEKQATESSARRLPDGFTVHNVRLDDGTFTRPCEPLEMSENLWFRSAKRALSLAFGGSLAGRSIVDLGCLEGGYTAEFARLGMERLGSRYGAAAI